MYEIMASGLFRKNVYLQSPQLLFFQKFEPLEELENISIILLHSNFTSQTTLELINILKGRILNNYEEIIDVAHSRKPPISALLWNKNDFKVFDTIRVNFYK